MAGIYVNDNGTWKLPKSIWVNDGTSTSGATGWRVCKNVYVNDNGFWREMIKSVDLTSSKNNFNLWNYVGSPTQPLSLIFNIASNVNIGSNDPVNRSNAPKRTPAFTVGNFPAGSTVIINNNGYISGGGGFGGWGGYEIQSGYNYNNRIYGVNGSAGGDAITKQSNNNFDCTIVNTGTIAAGGGDGGGAGANYTQGGQFIPGGYSAGGTGGDGAGITGYSRTQGGPSTASGSTSATNGGVGGNLGANGSVGTTSNGPGGGGGATGKAVDLGGIELAVYGNIIGVVS